MRQRSPEATASSAVPLSGDLFLPTSLVPQNQKVDGFLQCPSLLLLGYFYFLLQNFLRDACHHTVPPNTRLRAGAVTLPGTSADSRDVFMPGLLPLSSSIPVTILDGIAIHLNNPSDTPGLSVARPSRF